MPPDLPRGKRDSALDSRLEDKCAEIPVCVCVCVCGHSKAGDVCVWRRTDLCVSEPIQIVL